MEMHNITEGGHISAKEMYIARTDHSLPDGVTYIPNRRSNNIINAMLVRVPENWSWSWTPRSFKINDNHYVVILRNNNGRKVLSSTFRHIPLSYFSDKNKKIGLGTVIH